MNRRWQKDGTGRYDTLPSLGWLLSQLPPLPHTSGIADTADLYSVLSALHAKRRHPQPAACTEQGFYYFWADASPAAGAGAAQHELQASGTARREPVIPVSSKYQSLTMQRLATLFKLNADGPAVSHLLLAVVDDDGSVSLMRCFAHVQPPFEGPGVLPDAAAGQLPSAGEENDDSGED